MHNVGKSSMSFEKSCPGEGNEWVVAGQRHHFTSGNVRLVSSTRFVFYHVINVVFRLSLLSEGEFR